VTPDIEAIAEHVFVALADPTRRAILATLAIDGPSTATDLAARLPITRQAITKHLQSGPVQLAQQFLAALAHAWDDRLDALQRHLANPRPPDATDSTRPFHSPRR
jgi:DNA-binding transcriptional ArsR family regulator